MALKIGTENKTKTYAAIGLGVFVLLYGAYVLHDQFSSPAPVTVATPTPVRVPTSTSSASSDNRPASGLPATPFAHQAAVLPSSATLDPTLHPELMAQAEDTTYTGQGRNIFSADSTPTPVERKIETVNHSVRPGPPPPPPGPPPPPNIDLKFYGYSAVKNGGRKVFLQHGDDIFIAKEGDVVDRRYKVVKISPFSVDVEDLPYAHTQTLPLIQN
jgi:hypothetical protein